MSTSKQDDDKERREVLENDRKVREQQRGATMLDAARASADDELGGRFANAQGKQHIVGSTPVSYPPLPESSPWHGADPVGPEPPLGYRIDEMPTVEPAAGLPLPVAIGPTSDAPSPLVADDEQRDVGPPSSTSSKGEPNGA